MLLVAVVVVVVVVVGVVVEQDYKNASTIYFIPLLLLHISYCYHLTCREYTRRTSSVELEKKPSK